MTTEPDAQMPPMGTVAVHGGHTDHPLHAHLMPVFASSSFTFDSAEQGMERFADRRAGYTYSRFGNPTTEAAASAIAALETYGMDSAGFGEPVIQALLMPSGQAAMSCLFLSILSAGDAILSCSSLYGGTHEFFSQLLPRLGIEVYFDGMKNMDRLDDLFRNKPNIKVVHIETPANPTMSCIDIGSVAQIAKRYNIPVAVDNTIATPYLQQPFRYGADFVFHSTTKFLNGHGSAIGGVLLGRDMHFMNGRARQTQKLLGCNANPFDAFLVLQGIKTLPLRMEKHCRNAMEIALFLQQHPAVSKVYYNGLSDHPDHALCQKQMRHPGSVMSFELKEGFQQARAFINRLRLCVRAVSLGTTDTLVSHPASMSHAGMDKAERLKAGITDGLVRMSVGLEESADILEDLERALHA